MYVYYLHVNNYSDCMILCYYTCTCHTSDTCTLIIYMYHYKKPL